MSEKFTSGIDEGRLDKSKDEACLLLYFGKVMTSISETRDFLVKGFSNSVLALICKGGIKVVSRNPTSILMRDSSSERKMDG